MAIYLKTFCLIFLISNSLICDPYEQLNIDFLKNSNKKNIKKNKTLKEYGIGAQILTDLGAKKIILLTSSSKKIVGIDGFGLEVNGTKRL